ncbi:MULTISPECIES: DNA methyltransferase [Enterococcus]|uniref:site-specific DNA-methyltransferase (adenine-specific) n=1 Tax=Enterococcus thailandicus TaxID=417368 RepID=A0A179ES00_ENTTH|nr:MULTISPECIES: DNA methyltransferase [Enterococcus]MBD9901173.1 class I SAM-dependent DNA methyltransferase [Enterococcus faecium]OAQ55832.1 DNA methyltransferase [Enterococcus thailandicus]RBS51707.1 hypothetical protein EB25_00076 [Enterococcus faecium]TNX06366.1 class I SAM-dependent DNA methyltransferase [Enterococcus faecium]
MAKNKKLNIKKIEDGIKKIITTLKEESFIEEFLSLYEIPKASITRAKTKVREGNDFTIKNKIFYRAVEGDVVLAIDNIEQEIINHNSKPRYIITTDFSSMAAIDTKTRETLNIALAELPANADFFLAWNGIEKADDQVENPADRKAAERFARLYDVIAKDNPNADEHAFNMFLIRTLFLLFSEDTGIIPKASFTNVLKTRTSENANNMNDVISELFEILDTPQSNRKGKANWLLEFPYVNGKLFGEKHIPLTFSKESRRLLIEAGELLNWQDINPDILGAMIQSVASAEDRHVSGMHYTSVPNIMKVISPLFLDNLTEEYDKLVERYEAIDQSNITRTTPTKKEQGIISDIEALLERMSKIKFLDPASGSGNFLIIAYKEMRRLEIELLLLKQKAVLRDFLPISQISLNQFSGIELDDFAHEVARLSLWIAEHQMNEEMVAKIPSANPALLPLKDAGNIVQGNALRLDWNTVVPHEKDDEVYVMGNPPYIGSDKLKDDQKKDLDIVFNDLKRPKMDYISGWFYLGAKLIHNKERSKIAFVSTNSINQGSQVYKVWTKIFKFDLEIFFAYPSFKWNNSAKNNAKVIVSIIGLAPIGSKSEKYLYTNGNVKLVDNINAYLTDGSNVIVKNSRTSLSDFPNLVVGSRPNDNQCLIIENDVYLEEVQRDSRLIECTRKYVGGKQFTNDTFRYCIWLPTHSDYDKYRNIPFVEERVSKLKNLRLQKMDETSDEKKKLKYRELANNSYKFQNIRDEESIGWFIPQATSGTREYIPMGFIDEKSVIADPNFIIYNPTNWLPALLMSRMHMVWLNAVSGKLKDDYRYSVELVYNTFPIKNLSTQRKNEMSRVMLEILDLREYEGGTLAELYNKETMPESLRKKHEELDGIVDRAYRQKPFESDEERLSVLLKLYQEMTNE